MKKILLLYFTCFILFLTTHSQVSEDWFHPDNTTISLFENFTEDLHQDTWKASTNTLKGENTNPFIFIDSTLTIQIDSAKAQLQLSMHQVPGYQSADWSGKPLSADFVAGEIHTTKRFSYGIFECNALFAHGPGSFPAFWLMSFIPCDTTFLNEVDIVECSVRSRKVVLQNHIFYYETGCGDQTGHEFHETKNIDWSVPHTFKCIWDPYKITFWIDDRKLKEVKNSGQYWYPKHAMNVILSQQVSPGKVVTPQSSVFNWVKVREFLPAPEISSPEFVQNNAAGKAILNTDERVSKVAWELTPQKLFTGKTTGSGQTAAIQTGTKSGRGKIIYNFETADGEAFEAEKPISVGRKFRSIASKKPERETAKNSLTASGQFQIFPGGKNDWNGTLGPFHPGAEMLYNHHLKKSLSFSTGLSYLYSSWNKSVGEKSRFKRTAHELFVPVLLNSKLNGKFYASFGVYPGWLIKGKELYKNNIDVRNWTDNTENTDYTSGRKFSADLFLGLGFTEPTGENQALQIAPFVKYKLKDNWLAETRNRFSFGLKLSYSVQL